MKKHTTGFTLLELLVAMSIFAFMSIIAYGGLSNIMVNDKALTEQEEKLKELQRAVMFLERDFRQIVSRPRSSGYEEISNAFTYGLDSDGLLEFTRSGNSNPTGLARSSLQRIRYDLEEEILTRKSWSLVDHINAEPIEMDLLKNIEVFELRLLDSKNQWQTNWESEKEVPKAIEVTLEHKHWGKIVRLMPIK